MTTSHPGLELLSALVDDIDEDGTGDHVRECPQCAATLQELRQTAARVGERPVTSGDDDGQAERAVAAAMAAAGRSMAPVVPLARRRRLPAWILPAAAAVLVVAAGVPLAARLSRSGTTSHSTATQAPLSAGNNHGREEQAAGDTAGQAAVSDLGSINDAEHLRSALASVAGTGDAAALAPAVGSPPPAVPAPSPSNAAVSGAEGSTSEGSSAKCSASSPSGTTTISTALLVWQGTPAQVAVQARPNGTRVAVVTSRANCSELFVLAL